MRRPTWQLEWNDEISAGMPELDDDHRQFVSLINWFNHSITEGMNPAEIKKRLQLIVDNTAHHFEQEEKIFQELHYPGATIHVRTHGQIMKVLRKINEEFVPYDLDSGWVNAGLTIKDLVINHILTEDMKYANFYKSRNADTND